MPTGSPTKKKKCSICGDLFLPEKPSSKICKKIHYNCCPICGKQIEWNSTRQVEPCSKECKKEATRRRNREKYGCDHPMQNKDVQQNHKKAMLAKYGVESPLQSSEIREKVINTNRQKFGADWALGSAEIVQKSQQTMLERYGGKTTMESPELREKAVSTFKERYGEYTPAKVRRFREQAEATNLSKYGFKNPMSNTDVYNKLTQLGLNPSFEFYVSNMFYDVAIESSNVLIEVNPTYTHNTIGNRENPKGLSPEYHLNKTQNAAQHGYRCIHIFDWDDTNKVVSMLAPKKKIYARKCQLYRLRKEVAVEFLNKYHLQGSCRGQLLCLGLVFQDELVQVMTFGKPRYDKKHAVELLRLCTKSEVAVIGGASKLFSYATSEYGLSDIISYCDLSKFDGSVYEKIGMKKIRTTPPQEVWSREADKITANLLRAKGYDQIFKTHYGKGTSNEQLMLENGWLPVYDCGQAVYLFE
nr:MAG TPA: endonuclease-like protein [Caudoviricetes sp.]